MRIPLVVCVAAILLTPAAASAHAFGASLEATSTPYIIDIGYDPDPMESGRATRFELELRNLERDMVQDHEYVWIRILKEEETVLATGIHRQFFGPTTLLYTFADSGEHVIHVSYRTREGKEIASAEFPVTVARGDQYGFMPLLLAGCAVLIALSAIAVYVLAVRRTRALVQ